MSSFLTTAIPILSPIINFLFGKLISMYNSSQINAVCIPFIDKNLIKNIVSNNTYLVNLDSEIFNSLDSDEKLQSITGNLFSPRIIYNRSTAIVDELKDVITKSSNAISKFIFFSIDYRLLKYSGTGTQIIYCVPSDTYYQELKLMPEWDDITYMKVKNDMVLRK